MRYCSAVVRNTCIQTTLLSCKALQRYPEHKAPEAQHAKEPASNDANKFPGQVYKQRSYGRNARPAPYPLNAAHLGGLEAAAQRPAPESHQEPASLAHGGDRHTPGRRCPQKPWR